MKKSRGEFSNNMVIHRFTFENNQIMLFPRFTFITKKGAVLPKTGIIFYCDLIKT